MAYPRFRLSRAHKSITITSGNITSAATTWATVSGLSITLAAQAGDTLEIATSGVWNNVGATWGRLEPYSATRAGTCAPAGSSNGVIGWAGAPSVFANIGGSIFYTVVPGDLASGAVTIVIRQRMDAAVSRYVYATAADPFQFWVKNIGPADPT